MAKWIKQKIDKDSGPKKDVIKMAEREQETLSSIRVGDQKVLENKIHQYREVFPGKQKPKDVPWEQEVQQGMKVEPGREPHFRHHNDWDMQSRMR